MSHRIGITLCGVIHGLFFRGICKKERRSILIGNIIIRNTNLHLSPFGKLPFYAALEFSIMSYDFMKSPNVKMDEAKQPSTWFSVVIFSGVIFIIYVIHFLCCLGFMVRILFDEECAEGE